MTWIHTMHCSAWICVLRGGGGIAAGRCVGNARGGVRVAASHGACSSVSGAVCIAASRCVGNACGGGRVAASQRPRSVARVSGVRGVAANYSATKMASRNKYHGRNAQVCQEGTQPHWDDLQ